MHRKMAAVTSSYFKTAVIAAAVHNIKDKGTGRKDNFFSGFICTEWCVKYARVTTVQGGVRGRGQEVSCSPK